MKHVEKRLNRKRPRPKGTQNIVCTPLTPVFQMKWVLVAPLSAFTSHHMALLINGLPTRVRDRWAVMTRYNIPEYAKLTQTKKEYELSSFLKHIPWPLPWTFPEEIQKNLCIEMGIRWAMKRLLYQFRIRRVKGSDPKEPLIDPITFGPIVNPVHVYDMTLKRKFVFDARPLVKHVTNCLFQQEQIIPCAKPPFNVFTNRPFSYAQLLSITQQVIAAGIPSGHLLPYKEYKYDISNWKTFMASTLLMSAIKEETNNHESIDGQEMLIEFLISHLEELNIILLPKVEMFLENAIHWFPTHPSIQELRRMCIQYYEAKIFKIDIRLIVLNAVRRFYFNDLQGGPLWRLVQERTPS
jgi:hypothetical protein